LNSRVFAAEHAGGGTCSYRRTPAAPTMRPYQWQSRGNTMNTHTIDSAATQDARRLMNRALLRAGAAQVDVLVFARVVDGGKTPI